VKLREVNIQNIKYDVLRQRNIFVLAIKQNEVTIHASFAMTQIIAKNERYANECIMKSAEIICPEKQRLFEVINHCANRVADRVNGLAEDVKCHIKKREEFGGIFHYNLPEYRSYTYHAIRCAYWRCQ
jgi:hypothetical protein